MAGMPCSGGGLFDGQGVLIGLTTLDSMTCDAQNLNFAIPGDWVGELLQRHARPTAKPAASAPSDKMREQHGVYLSCPLPGAFAISQGGKRWYAWSTTPRDKSLPTDPAERALLSCRRMNNGACFLYAVDNRSASQNDTAALKP